MLCIKILAYPLNLRATKLQRYLGHPNLNYKKHAEMHIQAVAIPVLCFASYPQKFLLHFLMLHANNK